MTYDYVSIAKYSIFDYDYASNEKYSTHSNVSTDKNSTNHYVSTETYKKFLPIVCVTLFGLSDSNNQKGKLAGATYAERQLHKATIPPRNYVILTIKLQALNSSVKLWYLTIHYKNGRKQIVQLPGIIYQNGESQVIDLKEEGGIQSITFTLNAVTYSEQTPVVWIWGR